MILNAIYDALIDGIKLLPFLFATYLLMEYLEHKTSEKANSVIKSSGAFGPLLGSLLGVVPQCGFSTAASNLYAGRVITLGTLISIYLSTSDEMLPILISEKADILMILRILAVKVVIGVIAGFLIDLLIRKKHAANDEEEGLRIEHICDHEHCNCNETNVFASAIKHTLQVFIFIIIISIILNILMASIGEETISEFLSDKNILSIFLSGLIGLIPNCAASVIITKLYIKGLLSFGAMIAGLLAGAGVGLLVLFRVNDDYKDNLRIVSLLYIVGVASGIVFSLLVS